MIIEEIRKNAPDGSTFYTEVDGDIYYGKHDEKDVHLWLLGGWVISVPNMLLGHEIFL